MKLLRINVLVTVVIAAAVLLSACGGEPTFNGSKTADSDHFDIDFEILNTTYSHEMVMEAGEQIDVSVEQRSGNISLLIQKGDEQPVYRSADAQTASFSVVIQEAGTYTLSVTGKSAKGHVRFQRHRQSEAGKMDILNINGDLLGRIDERAWATVSDQGIFYSIFTLSESSPTATAEYRFFRLSDQKDILLGQLEDQSYEGVFCRHELNGIVYTLATTGNLTGNQLVNLYLLAFDPLQETMKSYPVSSYGLNFICLTVAGDKLLIRTYEFAGVSADVIYEFDPASETLREVLSFPEDPLNSLRSIYCSDGTLYLLRWHKAENRQELWLDSYDSHYEKISELPLTDVMLKGMDINGIITAEDAGMEFANNVSGFRVIDDRYLFYENYAVTRMLIDLKKQETLFSESDLYSLSLGEGTPAYYRMAFGGEEDLKPEILLWDTKSGSLREFSIHPVDNRCLLRTVSHSPGDNWLLEMHDSQGSRVLYLLTGN